MEALLERVIAIQPCVMCEIGSDCGGTLALFGRNADSNAKIISIDLNDSDERLVAFDQLVSPSIQLVTLVGNSHDASTLDQLEAALEGRSLDVLFIDGDHSLEGVYQDFRDYAPLLREGGILAFHDIVSDKVESASEKSATIYAGGVPEFYSKYIENAFSGESFIANQSQSGYGIGFVSWPDKTRANALVAQVVSEFEYCNDHRSEHRSKAA